MLEDAQAEARLAKAGGEGVKLLDVLEAVANRQHFHEELTKLLEAYEAKQYAHVPLSAHDREELRGQQEAQEAQLSQWALGGDAAGAGKPVEAGLGTAWRPPVYRKAEDGQGGLSAEEAMAMADTMDGWW